MSEDRFPPFPAMAAGSERGVGDQDKGSQHPLFTDPRAASRYRLWERWGTRGRAPGWGTARVLGAGGGSLLAGCPGACKPAAHPRQGSLLPQSSCSVPGREPGELADSGRARRVSPGSRTPDNHRWGAVREAVQTFAEELRVWVTCESFCCTHASTLPELAGKRLCGQRLP